MVMLVVIWLMQSLRFLDFIINKGLTVGVFLNLTLLLIPSLLIVIIPLGIAAGAIASFKRLHDANELSPLFTAGINRAAIAWSGVMLAFYAVIAGYMLTLWLAPAASHAFKTLQHGLRNTSGHLFLEEGAFTPIGKGVTVFLRTRQPNGQLEHIIVHDTRNPSKPNTWMAKSGYLFLTEQGTPRLQLVQGIRQEVAGTEVNMLEFAEHTLDIGQTLTPTSRAFKEAEERTFAELFDRDGLDKNEIAKLNAEIHKRLLWPLTPLPLVLLAAAFLVSSRGRRRGVLIPTLLCVAATIIYMAVLMSLHSMATKGNPAILFGQWLLPLGVSLVAFINLKRERV